MSRWGPQYQIQGPQNHFANSLAQVGEGVESLGNAFAQRKQQRTLDAEQQSRDVDRKLTQERLTRQEQHGYEQDQVQNAQHGYQRGLPGATDYTQQIGLKPGLTGTPDAPVFGQEGTGTQVGLGALKPGVEQRGDYTYRRGWDTQAQAVDQAESHFVRGLDAQRERQNTGYEQTRELIGVRGDLAERSAAANHLRALDEIREEASRGKWSHAPKVPPKTTDPVSFDAAEKAWIEKQMPAYMRESDYGAPTPEDAVKELRRRYRAIRGEPPMQGTAQENIRAQVSDSPPRPRARRSMEYVQPEAEGNMDAEIDLWRQSLR